MCELKQLGYAARIQFCCKICVTVVDPQLQYITDEVLTMPVWKMCEHRAKKILMPFSKCHYMYNVKVMVCCAVSA
jgi:hypothetical protein